MLTAREEMNSGIATRLRRMAKVLATLCAIEICLPGGTLIVISILLARRVPEISQRFTALPAILAVIQHPRRQQDLLAYYALRSF
jgi:hypothetical protein